MLLGNMQGYSREKKAGIHPGNEQGHSQERKERTGMLQEKKTGMIPEKGRKNMGALGTEGWEGPKEGTGTLCGPSGTSTQQLHNSRAQPLTAGPQEPSLHQPQPQASGPSLCLPSTDKINYQP